MKISRLEGVAILLTAMAVAFTGGWFLRGAENAPSIQVESQYLLSREARTLTEPTAEPSPSLSDPGGEKINLNTATAEELQRLPGIGATRAQAIVSDREANGPFRIPEDLTRVNGIGEGILQGLIDYVTVE